MRPSILSLPPPPPMLLLLLLIVCLLSSIPTSHAIQCYSGNQLQIIECPSLSCIKQTLGLDTVRYCDGSGVSSICQTYRLMNACQNIPNLGYICCCSDQLCNSAPPRSTAAALVGTLVSALIVAYTLFIRKS